MKQEFEAVSIPPAGTAGSGYLTYAQKRRAFRDWVYEHCCKGRRMKTPVPRGRDYDVKWTEPRCFGGDLYPVRVLDRRNPYSITPSILIEAVSHTPYAGTAEYLDSRQKVSRPKDLGNTMTLNLIHSLYEPGERVREATDGDPHELLLTDEEMDTGSMLLWQWMEDTAAALQAALNVAGMTAKAESILIEPLTENEAVSDRRPLYMGVVQVVLVGLNRQMPNPEISALLD